MSLEHLNPKSWQRRKKPSSQEVFEKLRKGDISALSRAITGVESKASEDYAFAKALLQQALPYSGNSFRLGITGVPGVGKSTFIESLGIHLIKLGFKVAVLAIDPSSSVSKGSILGDKTRMEQLVKSEFAYIRPSPAGETLGGVARKTREAILLCEAAGFDFIMVETVGVGQSETAVHSMTDFFLLLKLAGAGDDLQGIKRGIMEMADAVIINKADGDNKKAALHARREFQNALHLINPKSHQYPVKVHLCSGLHNEGIEEIAQEIASFRQHSNQNGSLLERRNSQELYWLHQTIEDRLKEAFYSRSEIINQIKEIETSVVERKISAFDAADRLLSL